MRAPLQFLTKFVCVSAVVFILWKPVSAVYFAFLQLEASAVFAILDRPARLQADREGASLVYPGLFPGASGHQIRIPILQRIAIHFNLIVVIALFAATPGIPYREKVKGAAVAIAVLSVLHTAHIYFLSYLFIWDYVDGARWPVKLSAGEIGQLARNVQRGFPRTDLPWIEALFDYWNHFLRESAALLAWLYFAHPHLGASPDGQRARNRGRSPGAQPGA